MGASLSGRELCSCKKGGSGIGKTKVDKGSKELLVVVGHGLPIGLHLDRTQPQKITLADQTLKTIRAAQERGRPRTIPKSLAADKAYDSRTLKKPTQLTPNFDRSDDGLSGCCKKQAANRGKDRHHERFPNNISSWFPIPYHARLVSFHKRNWDREI